MVFGRGVDSGKEIKKEKRKSWSVREKREKSWSVREKREKVGLSKKKEKKLVCQRCIHIDSGGA